MVKPKEESPEPAEADGPETTLKVLVVDQQLVKRAAAMRNQSIKELFMGEDVRDFFRHLIVEVAKKDGEHLQGKPKR